MDKSQLVGTIIMAVCCFGCGLLFFGIGSWAEKANKPVHFWSGSKVDPQKVSDVQSYNHECAVMWKLYSTPYWLSGILSCLNFMGDKFMIAAAILLFIACFPGLFFLVLRYRRIEKTYILC